MASRRQVSLDRSSLKRFLLAQMDVQVDVSAAGPARFGLRDAKAIQPGLQLEDSGLVSLPLTLAEADEPLTKRLVPSQMKFLNKGRNVSTS